MERQTETTQDRESRRFDEAFEQFGRQMAAWGEEFGRRMEEWGEEFGRQMEAWGKEFGPHMAVWAEELAQHVEKVGERIGRLFEEEMAASTADVARLREERLAILRMVQEGKISVAEAESLLRALGE